jgi:hypothetical protein
VKVKAGHRESRQTSDEEEPYDVPITQTFATTTVYSDGSTHTSYDTRVVGYRTEYRWCRTHYSPWGRVDQGGGHFLRQPSIPRGHHLIPGSDQYRTVVVFKRARELQYVSWQDEGEPVMFPTVVVVTAYFSSKFTMDPAGIALKDQMEGELFAEGRSHDTDVNVKTKCDVPGLPYCAKGALDEMEYECIQDVFRGCLGHCLWFFAMVLGYQAAVECFMSWTTGSTTVPLDKVMAMDRKYRALYKCRDKEAGTVAIDISERARKVIPPKRVVEA